MNSHKTISDISDISDIDAFFQLVNPVKEESRNITILTGLEGSKLIQKAFLKANTLDFLDWALETKKLLEHEYTRLKEMINSPDEDNLDMAIVILKQKNIIKH